MNTQYSRMKKIVNIYSICKIILRVSLEWKYFEMAHNILRFFFLKWWIVEWKLLTRTFAHQWWTFCSHLEANGIVHCLNGAFCLVTQTTTITISPVWRISFYFLDKKQDLTNCFSRLMVWYLHFSVNSQVRNKIPNFNEKDCQPKC